MPERLKVFFLVAAAAAIAAGCAHPQRVEIGTAAVEVSAYLGEPQAATPMPDGTERWTYSLDPADRRVWWLFFRDSRLVSLEQGLQRKYFAAIRTGEWTAGDVWAYWGKFLEEREFPLTGKRVWMYPFIDDDGMGRMARVVFNDRGVVEDLEVSDDPGSGYCGSPGGCGHCCDPWSCRDCWPWRYGGWFAGPVHGRRHGGPGPGPGPRR